MSNNKNQKILLIRHAPTQWNLDNRYQGHTDIELLEQSVRELNTKHLIPPFADWKIFSSPLKRAFQTAKLLSPGQEVHSSPLLIEINFGDWEGKTVAEVKPTLPTAPYEYDWRGLDFAPQNGESNRQVQNRFDKWLQDEFLKQTENAIVVTHKGLILSVLARAWNWEMDRKRPKKIDYNKGQLLEIDSNGKIYILELNIDYSIEKFR